MTETNQTSDPIHQPTGADGLAHDLNMLLREIKAVGKKGSIAETVLALEPLVGEIRAILAVELSRIFNQFQGDRVGSMEEKRAAAMAMNDLFDSLGLRVKCPKTGQPAILIGQTRGDGMGDGRFQLRIPGRVSGTQATAGLPEIELVLRDPREKLKGSYRGRL